MRVSFSRAARPSPRLLLDRRRPERRTPAGSRPPPATVKAVSVASPSSGACPLLRQPLPKRGHEGRAERLAPRGLRRGAPDERMLQEFLQEFRHRRPGGRQPPPGIVPARREARRPDELVQEDVRRPGVEAGDRGGVRPGGKHRDIRDPAQIEDRPRPRVGWANRRWCTRGVSGAPSPPAAMSRGRKSAMVVTPVRSAITAGAPICSVDRTLCAPSGLGTGRW